MTPTDGDAAKRTRMIERQGPSLSVQALEQAEQELGVLFPKDYREFMLEYNGGIPEPGYIVYKKNGKWAWSWVSGFSSITSARDDPLNLYGVNDVLKRYAAAGSPVPDGCFAIGEASPYEVILLCAEGRRRGEVWLKDWNDVTNIPGRTADPEEGMYRLATSFDKFLDTLTTEEEATKRTQSGARTSTHPKRRPQKRSRKREE